MIHRFRHSMAFAFLCIITVFAITGCGDSNFETVDKSDLPKTQSSSQPAQQPNATTGEQASAAGITWNVPAGWTSGRQSAMRVATYMVSSEDPNAECAVFYFGPGQGGGVQANIDRWVGQFDQPDGSDSKEKAQIGEIESNGLKVTAIDLTGTYQASMGGPMSGNKVARPDSRMLGAIVEAPQGPVFFKLTGSVSAIAQVEAAFKGMIQSIKKS